MCPFLVYNVCSRIRKAGAFIMNVYDFDNTILKGDSTVLFYGYCLVHHPKVWLDAPGQIMNAALFLLKRREKLAFKERMFRFLQYVDDVDAALEKFWAKNFRRVKKWYREMHRPDDVVISASPEFLVRPACEKLGIIYIMGSPVDKKTGKYSGLNCHGEEKVVRFRAVFPEGHINDFFSDSYSDTPLAKLAERAWMVKDDELTPW